MGKKEKNLENKPFFAKENNWDNKQLFHFHPKGGKKNVKKIEKK